MRLAIPINRLSGLTSLLALLAALLPVTKHAVTASTSHDSLSLAGYASKPYNGSVFVGDKTPSTFMEAFNWCQSLGGTLPSLHSRGDLDFMLDTLLMGSIWLGAMEIRDTYVWTDGSAWNPITDTYARPSCVSRTGQCDARSLAAGCRHGN